MATPSLMLSQVTCSMCKKTFTDPLLLPCQHTFCSSCIRGSSDDVKGEKEGGDPQVVCPQCGASFDLGECEADTKTLEVMELYSSCTEDRKQGAAKLKLQLQQRLHSRKRDKKADQEAGESRKSANGSLSMLRPGDHASVCSVVEEDTILCDICMKHGTKWMCMKCTLKTCDICRNTQRLLCKDQSREHIFVDYSNSPEADHEEEVNIQSVNRLRQDVGSMAMKKVTFEGIDDLTESSTDSDLLKPNYRDSLALTKDKKQRLEDIIRELKQMEGVGQSRCEALASYHDYMGEVKVAGFDLLTEAETLLQDRVRAFFVRMRGDYEQGFSEMTSATEEINSKMEGHLQSIQQEAAILEEIVDNNDTRVMMDQPFLDGKCDEVERSVVALAQEIVRCNSAGLRKSTAEWGPQEKGEFEKTMSCNILGAVEEEMERSLFGKMRAAVGDMRPEGGQDRSPEVKRVSKLLPSKDRRRWYDCVIS